jgi:hypothetical protein
MNWKIGFFIWLKGLGIFAIPCLLLFPLGFFAFPIALTISWVAIPVYACTLWLIKKLGLSHIPAMIFMVLISTSASVFAALYLLSVNDSEFFEGYNSITFWVPLLCCSLAVLLSNNSIYCYLDPESVSQEFIIE